MLFYRRDVDGERIDCSEALRGSYAGARPASCWIIGNGPSMLKLTEHEYGFLRESPAAKIAVNYGGKRSKESECGWGIKPNIWVGYDWCQRFSAATFMDSSIQKFVRDEKSADVIQLGVPVHNCPNTYCFTTEERDYHNFYDPTGNSVVHATDCLMTAIDIAVKLGFRTMYLIGCDMRVTPSEQQLQLSTELGVDYRKLYVQGIPIDTLRAWMDALVLKTEKKEEEIIALMEALEREVQYDHEERKPLYLAIQSDKHYWNTVQHLRLSLKGMQKYGINLVSCTEESRLNNIIPYRSMYDVMNDMEALYGSVCAESTKGKYSHCNPAGDTNSPYTLHLSPPRKAIDAPSPGDIPMRDANGKLTGMIKKVGNPQKIGFNSAWIDEAKKVVVDG